MRKLITALGIAGLCTLPLSGLAAGYKEISVSNGGSISGKVSFSGEDPAPRVYRVTKDSQVCGEGNREIDYVRVNNGALQDVVVYLDKVSEGKPFPPELGDGSTVQEACEFKPYFSVMRNNAKFESVNRDPVLHNIHTYEILGRRKKTVFNISQPDQNTVVGDVTLKRGITSDMQIWDWRARVEEGDMDGARTNCSIAMQDRNYKDVARWDFELAWPSKVSGPSLKSDSNEFGLEELVLVHEGMKRVA